MFVIECRGCGQNLHAGVERAGKKGRCPECATEYEVPENKQAFETEFSSADFYLKQLLDSFSKTYPSRILAIFTQIVEGHKHTFVELRTGHNNHRRQVVVISPYSIENFTARYQDIIDPFPYQDSSSAYYITSTIGEAVREGDITTTLQIAGCMNHATLQVDEDKLLSCHRFIPDLEAMDKREFPLILFEIAHHTDLLEEALFGVDFY